MFKEQKRTTKNGVEIYDYKNPDVHGFPIAFIFFINNFKSRVLFLILLSYF